MKNDANIIKILSRQSVLILAMDKHALAFALERTDSLEENASDGTSNEANDETGDEMDLENLDIEENLEESSELDESIEEEDIEAIEDLDALEGDLDEGLEEGLEGELEEGLEEGLEDELEEGLEGGLEDIDDLGDRANSSNGSVSNALIEYGKSNAVFILTQVAMKSGGEYPTDINMTSQKYFNGIKHKASLEKLEAIDIVYNSFSEQIEYLKKAHPKSERFKTAYLELTQLSTELRQLNSELVAVYTALTDKKNRDVLISAIASTIIVLTLLLATLLFFQKIILSPIDKLTSLLKDISQGKGDLTVRLATEQDDEIGIMANHFNQFISKIADVIIQVKETMQSVKESSSNIQTVFTGTADTVIRSAASSNAISEGSTKQNEDLQEVEETMNSVKALIKNADKSFKEQVETSNTAVTLSNEISQAIDQVASDIEKISISSDETINVAHEGENRVNKSVKAISSIKEEVTKVSTHLSRLGESSEQIGAIVSVITEIASQTNLLALNAAIEAARAGESGKGFAVVADEVRKLAERSDGATQEIADLISNIQEMTRLSISSMNIGTDNVDKGVALADDAKNSLVDILNAINDNRLQTQSISASSGKMATNANSVLQAMDRLKQQIEDASNHIDTILTQSEQVSVSIIENKHVSEENREKTKELAEASDEISSSMNNAKTSINELNNKIENLDQLVNQFKV
jgi:methyl-accepting chemotaxis protein